MRNLTVVMLLLVAAMAGCADDTTSEPPAPGPGDGSETGGDQEGDPGAEPEDPADEEPGADPEPQDPGPRDENLATPTANISVKSLNVTVPRNVTFTLDGADDDGDALTWEFYGVGEDPIQSGETLPATVVHEITEAGNHTFRLEVSDGTHIGVATVNLTGIEPPVLGPEPVTLDFDVTRSCYQCYTNVPLVIGFPSPDHCIGLLTGSNNQDCAWVEIDDAWRGRPFTTEGPNDVDVAWYTECSAGNEIDTIGADGHDSGTIDETAACLVIWDWSSSTDAAVLSMHIGV